MPYIKPLQRDSIDLLLEPLILTISAESYDTGTVPYGRLNYVITRLLVDTIKDFIQVPGDDLATLRYDDYNALIGVLECAKLELYRQLVAKYEDIKIEENGPVFEEL
jgi:hypothetical protein